MKTEYRLYEVEEAIAEMDLSEVADDIAEVDDTMQLWISGWCVYVPELSLYLREGIVCVWDDEEKVFLPDFSVTVLYEGEAEKEKWLYYEQDGFVITLANFLHGKKEAEEIEQCRCRIILPAETKKTEE